MSLTVSPSNATLAVQEVAQFGAVARDEFGNVVTGAIKWETAGGGSIGPTGLFTAGTVAGTFADTVTASLLTDTLELVASASVTVEPGPLFEASIHPAETSLDIGSVQSFEVGMRDRFGNPIPEALISWKTTEDAGTVNADGQFTDGTKTGSFPGAVQVEVVTGRRKSFGRRGCFHRAGPSGNHRSAAVVHRRGKGNLPTVLGGQLRSVWK